MKLSILRGGGLSGRTIRTEVTSDSLSPEDAKALHERVVESGVLTMPPDPPAAPAHPDEFEYELTVDHGDGSHTVHRPQSALSPELRSLIKWADAHPESEHASVPPGGG
jgi:hypothetical protein